MGVNKQLRVLLVSPKPPPVGGIAAWTVNLLAYASSRPEVELIHLNSAIKFRSITQFGIIRRIWAGIGEAAYLACRFVVAMIHKRPQVIHHTSSASLGLFRDWLLLKLAQWYKIKFIVHFRFGRIPDLANKGNWEWRILRCVVRCAARAMVIDRLSLEALQAAGLMNVCLVPNPMSQELEFLAKDSHGTGASMGGSNKILFVGHIIPDKGVRELVGACTRLPDEATLRLVGPVDEDFRRELLTLSATRAGDWLVFVGTKSADEVQEELRQATMLALPSYTEGFPNVVIEAMAAGCPVVATPVGAISDMLDFDAQNPAGMCVSVRDVDALANAIKSLMDNPQQRLSMAMRAREKVKLYSMKVVFNQYLTVWDKVVNSDF